HSPQSQRRPPAPVSMILPPVHSRARAPRPASAAAWCAWHRETGQEGDPGRLASTGVVIRKRLPHARPGPSVGLACATGTGAVIQINTIAGAIMPPRQHRSSDRGLYHMDRLASVEDIQGREVAVLEVFQRGAAAGGDVADLVAEAH